jgi:mannose-1-phosphate guanylyltransferase
MLVQGARDMTAHRQALILSAGLGTRLRPLTQVRAKPAIPVAGEAMIRRIAAWLAGAGIDDLVVNLHHRPETLTACLGDGADLGTRVRYSWELPRILGSAGGPRLARPILGAATFFIINGDTLTDVDLGEVSAAHKASGALVTLALVPNREFLRYGGVRVAGDGAITGFVRRGPAAEGTYHYIGVQLVAARVFDGIAAGTPASSIGGVYDALIAAQPGSVRASISDAAFFDVGTPADYWRTSQAFAPSTGLAAGSGGSAGSPFGARVEIDPSARVTRSILWDDVTVEAGAQLDECIVTDGVHVAEGASHRREILMCGEDGRTRVSPLNLEP